jgi:hypothetical protein
MRRKYSLILSVGLLCLLLLGGMACTMTDVMTMRFAAAPTPNCLEDMARGVDDEAAQHIRSTLEQAGITVTSVSMSYSGEDLVCYQDRKQVSRQALIRFFSPEIIVPVTDTDTPETMGATLITILQTIETVKFSGYTGIVRITFQVPGAKPVLWQRDYLAAMRELSDGMTGETLFNTGTSQY